MFNEKEKNPFCDNNNNNNSVRVNAITNSNWISITI